MNINIFSLGQNKKQDIINLEKEYIKRLRSFCNIEIKEFKKERQLLLELKKSNYYKVGLEEKGEMFNTRQFAKWLVGKKNEAVNVCFIVADENGFKDEIKKVFNYKLSLSALTFPHEIARMLLTEQLYRAFTILSNHPYHR